MNLFHNSSVYLAHALLAFGRLQGVLRLDPSYMGWFPYSFGEGAVELVEELTVLC